MDLFGDISHIGLWDLFLLVMSIIGFLQIFEWLRGAMSGEEASRRLHEPCPLCEAERVHTETFAPTVEKDATASVSSSVPTVTKTGVGATHRGRSARM